MEGFASAAAAALEADRTVAGERPGAAEVGGIPADIIAPVESWAQILGTIGSTIAALTGVRAVADVWSENQCRELARGIVRVGEKRGWSIATDESPEVALALTAGMMLVGTVMVVRQARAAAGGDEAEKQPAGDGQGD